MDINVALQAIEAFQGSSYGLGLPLHEVEAFWTAFWPSFWQGFEVGQNI